MAIGLGVLKLSPEAFWRMTLPELAAALDAVLPPPDAAPSRAKFQALQARFPD